MSTSGPRITTLIPTYRRSDLLPRAIQSALNQTITDLQVLVLDNASGDDTKNVVDEIARRDARVKYFCHRENIGLWGNFNFALSQVKTPFFSILCDDDLILPHFYERALQQFDEHPDAFLVGGALFVTDPDMKLISRVPVKAGYFTPPEGLLSWRFNERPYITSYLVRREITELCAPFDNCMMADNDFEMRIAAQFPYVVVDEPWAVLLTHPGSSTQNTIVNFAEWTTGLDLIRNQLSTLPNLPPEIAAEAMKTLAKDISDTVYRRGLIAVSRGELSVANQTAVFLRETMKAEELAANLSRIAQSAEKLRVFQKAFHTLHKIRTDIRQSRMRPLRNQLRHHLQVPEVKL